MLKKLLKSSDQMSFRRDLIRTAIIPLVAMGLFLIISWWQLDRLRLANQLVDHSDQVMAQARKVQALMVDMETGIRGYLLTDSSAFLDPYQKATPVIGGEIDMLAQLVSDNAAQTELVKSLRSTSGQWQQLAQQAIAVKSISILDAQLQGKSLMDQVRQQISTVIDNESALSVTRRETAQQISQAIIPERIFIAILLGIIMAFYIRRGFTNLSRRFADALRNAQLLADEAQLRREWLQGTLASIGDGVIATDTQGNVTFINKVAQTLAQANLPDTIGKPLAAVFKVVDEQTRAPIATAILTDELTDSASGAASQNIGHVLLLGCAGRETPIENSVALIRNAQGLTLGTVVVFRDMTERRLTDAKLIASEHRYRDLTNAMPLMLWTATPAGEIDYRNQQWFEYTGLTAAQSTSVVESQAALYPDDVETSVQQWANALKTGQPYEIENRWKRASDGVYLWHLGRTVPICDEKGQIAAWVGTLTNIDKQKNAETTLLERTADLEVSARQLEDRNIELDQFAYITSHDLKAPLRGIANLSQWIEEDLGGNVTEEIHKQMELLRGRVHRMEGLIDGILQYSRVGRVKNAVETVNVETFLQELIDLIAPPPEITITVEPGMPVFRAERILLQQVFSNLIGNAIKHRSKAQGHVIVGVKEQRKFYEFTVNDDGPGIPPEFHQKIFVIFQTLESRDKVEGSGLGLALVKKIVEQQGGKVWLESSVGVGTTFHFTWPKLVKEKQ